MPPNPPPTHTHTPKKKIKSSLGGKMCYQIFSVKTIIHTVYWPNNNEVVKFMWSTHENISVPMAVAAKSRN